MRSTKKITLTAVRIIVGVLFIASGLIKANDPLGLGYKIDEYFDVLNLQFLVPASLTFAVLMIGFEIIAGFALLLGFKMRIFGPLLVLLMIFFLFLTGFAFLTGKIKECGCFGECVPLTAEMSFWKDVILFFLVLFIFFNRKQIEPILSIKINGMLMILVALFSFGLQGYVLRHLPLVDCLAYRPGNNIRKLMELPPGATPDIYKSVFIYEKDGEKKEFDEDHIPWEDSTWQYVDRKDKLVQKGVGEPQIVDFVISDFEGNIVTDLILDEKGYVFLFMVKQVEEAGKGWDRKMEGLQESMKNSGVQVYGITASSEKSVDAFKKEHRLDFPFLQMDGVVIKTAMRNNPGLMLLKEGTIQEKWGYRDMPKKMSVKNGEIAFDF